MCSLWHRRWPKTKTNTTVCWEDELLSGLIVRADFLALAEVWTPAKCFSSECFDAIKRRCNVMMDR